MANRTINGATGTLIIVDSDITLTAGVQDAVVICINTQPILITLTGFITPGVTFTIINKTTDISHEIRVQSAVGDKIINELGEQSFIYLDMNIEGHFDYDVMEKKWWLTTVGVSSIAIQSELKMVELAAATIGFVTEYRITDIDYPYLNEQNIDFKISHVNNFELIMTATGPVMYGDGTLNYNSRSVKTFPAITFPLIQVPLSGPDGIYFRFIGISQNGSLEYAETPFNDDQYIVNLGLMLLKKVGGTVTLLDGFSESVFTIPTMAGVNNLQRKAPVFTNLMFKPNGINMQLFYETGRIVAESCNWAAAPDVHERVMPRTLAPFFHILAPNYKLSTTLPPKVQNINSNLWWNGTVVTNIPGIDQISSVQRVLMSTQGDIIVQLGEQLYPTLQDAVDGMSSAAFTELAPPELLFEVCRIALRKTTSNLSDEE